MSWVLVSMSVCVYGKHIEKAHTLKGIACAGGGEVDADVTYYMG